MFSNSEWNSLVQNYSGEKKIVAGQISSVLSKITQNSTPLPQKLDWLIEIHDLCANRPENFQKMKNDTTSFLEIILNTSDEVLLAQRISERKSIQQIDPDYIPGLSSSIAKGSDSSQSRTKALLLELGNKKLKLETASERLLSSIRNEFHKGGRRALEELCEGKAEELGIASEKIAYMKKEINTPIDQLQLSEKEKHFFSEMKKAYILAGNKAANEDYKSHKDYTTASGAPEQYFNPDEKAEFRVIPAQGKLYSIQTSGAGDDSHLEIDFFNKSQKKDAMSEEEIIYAINPRGEMYVFPSVDKESDKSRWDKPTHHTTALSGDAVMCAGVIKIDDNGVLRSLNNESGHYMPKARQLFTAIDYLKAQGVLYQNTELQLLEFDARSKKIKHTISTAGFEQFYPIESMRLDAANTIKEFDSTNAEINKAIEFLQSELAASNNPQQILMKVFHRYLASSMEQKASSNVYESFLNKSLGITHSAKGYDSAHAKASITEKMKLVVGVKLVDELTQSAAKSVELESPSMLKRFYKIFSTDAEEQAHKQSLQKLCASDTSNICANYKQLLEVTKSKDIEISEDTSKSPKQSTHQIKK